jgi:hypothetical protein
LRYITAHSFPIPSKAAKAKSDSEREPERFSSVLWVRNSVVARMFCSKN